MEWTIVGGKKSLVDFFFFNISRLIAGQIE